MIKNNNSNLEKDIFEANQNYLNKNIETAIKLYTEILKKDPNNKDVHNNIGVAHLAINKNEIAIDHFESSIQIDPKYIDGLMNLAITYNILGENQKAINCYKKVIEINPSYTKSYTNLARIYKKLKDYKKSMNYFEISLRLKLENHKDHIDDTLFIFDEMSNRRFFSNKNPEQITVDSKESPLLTWPLLDFIKNLDLKNDILHELGSGNSTFLFSSIFKKVESYETNRQWFETLKPKVGNNVSLRLITLEDIYSCLMKFKTTDWLLIDFAGKRTKFIFKLIQLSDDYIPSQIILDNSGWYRTGAKLLIDRGFIEIPFHGFKSSKPYIDCTSLFLLKNNFNLKFISKFYQPKFSLNFDNNNKWDRID